MGPEGPARLPRRGGRIRAGLGVLRLTRARRAFLGLLAAWLLIAGGFWLAAGPGPALVAAGALLAAYVIALFDVDEPEPEPEPEPRYRSDLPEPVLRLAQLTDHEEGL